MVYVLNRDPPFFLSLSLLLLLLSFLFFSVLVRDPRGRGQVRFNFGERDRPLRFLPMVPNWKKCARRWRRERESSGRDLHACFA